MNKDDKKTGVEFSIKEGEVSEEVEKDGEEMTRLIEETEQEGKKKKKKRRERDEDDHLKEKGEKRKKKRKSHQD
jgi:hypothetical protein